MSSETLLTLTTGDLKVNLKVTKLKVMLQEDEIDSLM